MNDGNMATAPNITSCLLIRDQVKSLPIPGSLADCYNHPSGLKKRGATLDVRFHSSFLTQSLDRRDSQFSAPFERRLGKIFAAFAVGDCPRAMRLARTLLRALGAWPTKHLPPSSHQRARFWFLCARLHCACGDWTGAFETVFYCLQSIPQNEGQAIVEAHALFSQISAALDYFEQSRVSLSVVLDGLPGICAQHGDVADVRCLTLAQRAIRQVARGELPAAMADARAAAEILEGWLTQQGQPLVGNERLLPHAVFGDLDVIRFEGYPERLQCLPPEVRLGQDARSANWRYAAIMVPWAIAFIKYWWARSDLLANQIEMPECFHLAFGALKAGRHLIPGHVFLIRASSLVTDIPVAAGLSSRTKRLLATWLAYTSAGRRLMLDVLTDLERDPRHTRECQLVERLAELHEKVLSQRLSPSPDFHPIICAVNVLRRQARQHANQHPGSYHLVARCLYLLGAIYAILEEWHTAFAHAHLALRAFTYQTAGEAFLPRLASTQRFMDSLAKLVG